MAEPEETDGSAILASTLGEQQPVQARPAPTGASTLTDVRERPGDVGGTISEVLPEGRDRPATLDGTISESPTPVGTVKSVDLVREHLAKWLVMMLSGTILLGVAVLATTRWTHLVPDNVSSTFELFFTALVTLLSSVIGFYFGSERN